MLGLLWNHFTKICKDVILHLPSSSYTNLACLPSSDALEGKTCLITGWGTTKANGEQADKLVVAKVPIVRQAVCKTAYNKLGADIDASMVCAGFPKGGKDSCQGDSGGPLVCSDGNGAYSLHGVTSWGIGCAQKGRYGVYARVNYLLKWITDEIKKN